MEETQAISEPRAVQNKSFEILVVGENAEISQAIADLEQKNKAVKIDRLVFDETSAEGGTFPVYHPDLLAGYDLILLRHLDNSLGHRILADARKKKVMVSVFHDHGYEPHVGLPKTKHLLTGNTRNKDEKYWIRVANRCLFALAFIIVGHVISSYFPFHSYSDGIKDLVMSIDLDAAFGWMVLAGFVAQMVDGALGMGYGVISTTVLLSTGLNPAAISGSIHTAEMFSSGASGYSHYRFGNINKKLFKTLLLPGVAGAVVGALLLCWLGEEYGDWLRPVLSVYTLLLGLRILTNAFKKKRESQKVKNAGWLAGAGGFLDSFGGGGWGPLVTSTLISKGKTPRYIIGTVSLTEFFVTFGSALTFFVILGTSHIQTIAGLIIGGLLAAPLAAKLAGRMKTKTMLISVGSLVILSSIRTIWKTVSAL